MPELDVIVEEILQGEGLELLKRLNPQERDTAWQILQEIKKSGINDWIDSLWSLDYDINPPTVKEFLESPEYFKHVGDDLYPKWKNEMLSFLDPTNYCHEIILRGCLAGSTKLSMLDGSHKTMLEIMMDFKKGDKNQWILSYNRNRNCWEPDKIVDAFTTGIKKTYRITLDNGNSVECTSDHPFLTRGNNWMSIDSGLSVGQSMMPFNWKDDWDYYLLMTPGIKGWQSRYQIVGDWKNIKSAGQHYHHKDFNKLNDMPSNLCTLNKDTHWKYHCKKGGKRFEEWRESLGEDYYQIITERCIRAANALHHDKNHQESRQLVYDNFNERIGHNVEEQRRLARLAHEKAPHINKNIIAYNKSDKGNQEQINQTLNEIRQQDPNYNHSIVSIECVGEQWVYDLTIERNHNFALDCGLVAKNCIGSGKSWVGATIAAYEICLLMHLKDPQSFLSHGAGAPIYLGLISSDLSQLEKNLWNYTLQFMKGSPFFKKHSSLQPDHDYKGLSVKFPKNIHLIGGSLPPHILGLNLYFACLDESNYRRTADPQEEAFRFYSKLKNRVENRFIERSGKGRIVLISSEGDEGSFLDDHCAKLKLSDTKDAHVCQFAEWEIIPMEEKPTSWFKVDIGDNLRSPLILSEGEEARQGAKIVTVPDVGTYRKSAERDLINFLKERAGVVPGRANKYFYNVEAFSRCFTLHNPMLMEIAELALDTQYAASDYVDEGRLIIKIMGKWRPKEAPEASRYVHIDLAKNQDLAGFSMCHIGDYAEGGSPIIHQDLCVAFSASKSKPIDFDKIVEFVKWLRDVGFRINLVTYDSWQSLHSVNILDKSGFKVKNRSMDELKNTTHGKIQMSYNEFRSMVALERVLLVDSPRLRREGIELQNVGDRPDHPDGGSKDMIDATVGSFANAIEINKGSDPLGDNFRMQQAMSMIPKKKDEKELVTRDQLLGDVNRDEEGTFYNP